MLVREYLDSDFESVVGLMTALQSYFKEIDIYGEKVDFENRESTEKYINQAFEDVAKMNGKVFVAESDDKVIGFVQGIISEHKDDAMHNLTHAKGNAGWIGLLFVDSNYRSKGIAQSLLEKMKDYFKQKGCSSMRLKVDSNNKLAINVYEKYGFTPRDLEMAIKI